MPQLTFAGVGDMGGAQSDDAETMSIIELSNTGQDVFQITFPVWVKIVDMRVPNDPAEVHQYGLWFQGAKKPGNLYATDLNPNQAGRVIFELVEQVYIRPGTIFQIKTAQQSGMMAEATRLAFVYRNEAPPGV